MLTDRNAVRDDASDGEKQVLATGVGLSTIERRLAQLYGSSQTFRAGRSNDGHFEVILMLPYHT